MTSSSASNISLGVPGYTFADLHDPERLGSLYDRFCEGVAAADPALWAEWDTYRRDSAVPSGPRMAPVALSNLLVAMAPHLSRFVARLFDVGTATGRLVAATRAEDDLFRFKVDFVRRRAMPLLKGGAHVVSSPDDDAVVDALIAGAAVDGDREQAGLGLEHGREQEERNSQTRGTEDARHRSNRTCRRYCRYGEL